MLLKPFDRLLLVAGVPKAGTSSIELGLRRTALALVAPEKEPHYLCAQINGINRTPLFRPTRSASEYIKLFNRRNVQDRAVALDCDPLTFQDNEAADRALAIADEVRTVVILRNPVSRFISHYLNDWRECIEARELSEVVDNDLATYEELGNRYLPYTWHSFYSPWIRHWTAKIGKENLLFLKFEDIVESPKVCSRRIIDFLDLVDLQGNNLFATVRNPAGRPRGAITEWLLKGRQRFPLLRQLYLRMPQHSREFVREKLLFTDDVPELTADGLRFRLLKHYESDIRETSELLGWDVGDWLVVKPGKKEKPGRARTVRAQGQHPIAAIVWAQYGPYHHARLAATRSLLGPERVIGIELANRTTTYDWMSGTVEQNKIITLREGEVVEQIKATSVYRAAVRTFRERNIRVVFVPSYWPASSLAIILAARNVGARLVMMNDSHALTAKVGGILAKLKRGLVIRFDSALVGGTSHKEYFAGMGLSPEKIILGYDTVDNGYFEGRAISAKRQAQLVRAKYGLPQRYFLNVGRMIWKKNLETLVDAYKQVKERLGKNCPRLVLVGGGKLERLLKERCLSHGLSIWQAAASSAEARPGDADVSFYGFRQVDELPDFYALAECFVLPSREEEWGLVVNEAMACGLPVLVSRVAGCARDLVHDGENGFLFDPFDVKNLADRLQSIALQPERAQSMGAASRKIIADWGCERFAQGAREAMEIALR